MPGLIYTWRRFQAWESEILSRVEQTTAAFDKVETSLGKEKQTEVACVMFALSNWHNTHNNQFHEFFIPS